MQLGAVTLLVLLVSGAQAQMVTRLPTDAPRMVGSSGTNPVAARTATMPLKPPPDLTARPDVAPSSAAADPAATSPKAAAASRTVSTGLRGPIKSQQTVPTGTARPSSRGSRSKRSSANDPQGSLHQTLADNAPLFRSLLDILAIGPDDIQPTTVGTFFAPTDKALSAFLESMSLSASQLKGRPELVDLIVSYHFVPGYQVQGLDDVADSGKVMLTGEEQYIVNLNTSKAGKLVVQDVQRNRAKVLGGPIKPDNGDVTVFVIDRVMFSGNYFPSMQAALAHSPYWVTASALAKKAEVLPTLEGSPVTLFVPDNAAFKPLEINFTRASPARLADILRYHAVRGSRIVPGGFKSGFIPTLLKEHSLNITLKLDNQEKDPFSGNKTDVPRVTIGPEVGLPAKIIYYNIFAGNSMLQGIDRVLMPELPEDLEEGPPPEDEQPPEEDDGPEQGPQGPVTSQGVSDEAGMKGASVTAPVRGRQGVRSKGPGTKQGRGAAGGPTSEAEDMVSDDTEAPAPQQRMRGAKLTPSSKLGDEQLGFTQGSGTTDRRRRSSSSSSSNGGDGTSRASLPGVRIVQPPGGASGLQRPLPWIPTPARTPALIGARTSPDGGPMIADVSSPEGDAVEGPGRHLLAMRELMQTAKADAGPVAVGAIGQLQSFANGISTSKTITALNLAAKPKVPKQYVNRYGSFKGPTAKNGCLNCRAWGNQQQQDGQQMQRQGQQKQWQGPAQRQ